MLASGTMWERTALVLLSFAAFACGGGNEGSPEESSVGSRAGEVGSGGSGGTGPTVTWASDIAPIVDRECVGCHREGGIAPFSLTSYADAAPRARSMASATRDRIMPPMPVDNSGSCNTFANARWLDDDEIALIAAWSAAGAPEGDRSKTPPVPPPPAGLTRVDVTVDPGESYTPNPGYTDDYRCFVVDPGLAAPTFLVAYDVVPGDARIVHHAILYAPSSDEESQNAVDLDAAEAGLGYTCFGSSRVDASPLAIWAPGGGVTTLPTDTGLALPARKLVLEVHYNVQAGVFPDRTTVRIQTSPVVSHPAALVPIGDLSLSVPPGEELAVSMREFTLKEPLGTATVYGVVPHMHTLGRTLGLQATIGSDSLCMVSVDRWDFHWQNAWWYEHPMSVTGATSFTLSCGYDTRERTDNVTWGDGTRDEMCLVYLYAAL